MSEQFPFLIRLVDDESPVVRQEVRRALVQIPDLKARFEKLEPTGSQRSHLQSLLESCGYTGQQLLENWNEVDFEQDRESVFEQVLDLVSIYQTGFIRIPRLPGLLDSVAEEYRRACGDPDVRALSDFLFGRDGLQGDREDYYNPRNSNLVDVWYRKKGNPISLAAFYILVGRRLGLAVEPCNFPGHFLARVREGKATYFVDCFARGRFMDQRLTPELGGRVPLHALSTVLRAEATATALVSRVLNNLVASYQQLEQIQRSNLFVFLLKAMERGGGLPERPQFSPGNLVRHRSRKFRGVVVDYDLHFEPEGDRVARDPSLEDQPWYRVLVDGSSVVSYSAESNLREDSSQEEVRHPLVNYFFQKFEDGLYYRNNLPWPK